MEVKKIATSSHIPDQYKNYKLSALIGVDSFFYAITETKSDQIVEINQVDIDADQQSELLNKYKLLSSAKIAIVSNLYTIVPSDEYNQSYLEDMMTHVIHPTHRSHYILKADFVSCADIYVCYAIPKRLYKYCFSFPPIPVISHQITTLLPQLMSAHHPSVIHLTTYRDDTLIIAMTDGTLRMVSSYKLLTSLSTLYYIMLVQQSLNIDKDNLEIQVSGDLLPNGSTHQLLSRYYKHLSFRTSSIKIDGQLIDHASIYFPLQSVTSCV